MVQFDAVERIDCEVVEIYPSGSPFAEGCMAERTPKNSKVKPGRINWTAVGVVVAILGAFGAVVHHVDIRFASLDIRLAKVESAVRVLADKQSDQTKQLIHDLLAAAENSALEKPEIATRAIQVASSLIAAMRNEKRPADSEYFQTTIKALDHLMTRPTQPQLSKAVHSTRIALAEYRSALGAMPPLPTKQQAFPHTPGAPITAPTLGPGAYRITQGLPLPRNIHWLSDGAAINASEIPTGVDILTPTSRSLSANNNAVTGLIFVGAAQTLDGIRWENVVFVNTHIKYLGGQVALANVRFVNCTFEVQESDRGTQMTNYAALQGASLVIG